MGDQEAQAECSSLIEAPRPFSDNHTSKKTDWAFLKEYWPYPPLYRLAGEPKDLNEVLFVHLDRLPLEPADPQSRLSRIHVIYEPEGATDKYDFFTLLHAGAVVLMYTFHPADSPPPGWGAAKPVVAASRGGLLLEYRRDLDGRSFPGAVSSNHDWRKIGWDTRVANGTVRFEMATSPRVWSEEESLELYGSLTEA